MMTRHYTAYGLSFESALTIPEFLPCSSESFDVQIGFGKLACPPSLDASGSYFNVGPQEAYLYWKQVGAFLIRNGTRSLLILFREWRTAP